VGPANSDSVFSNSPECFELKFISHGFVLQLDTVGYFKLLLFQTIFRFSWVRNREVQLYWRLRYSRLTSSTAFSSASASSSESWRPRACQETEKGEFDFQALTPALEHRARARARARVQILSALYSVTKWYLRTWSTSVWARHYFVSGPRHLARGVVRKMDNAIHWINH